MEECIELDSASYAGDVPNFNGELLGAYGPQMHGRAPSERRDRTRVLSLRPSTTPARREDEEYQDGPLLRTGSDSG